MTDRTDNFDRADTTSAIGTPSDGGSAWVQQSGTWGISSNQGYESAGASQAAAVLESSVSDVATQATLSVVGNNCGLVNRAADNSNYILADVPGADIYKRVAGAFTLIGSGSTTFSAGDVLKLSSDSSNVHTSYKNGVQIATATDAAGSTNTKHGIRAHSSAATRFDDFSITALGGTVVVPWPLLMGMI